MGPETKKHDNDQTNKHRLFHSFVVKTELSSDKISISDTIIYIKCNETNLNI